MTNVLTRAAWHERSGRAIDGGGRQGAFPSPGDVEQPPADSALPTPKLVLVAHPPTFRNHAMI